MMREPDTRLVRRAALSDTDERTQSMTGTRGYRHTIYRLTEDAEPVQVGKFDVDPTSYQLAGEDEDLTAERFLSDYWQANTLEPGQYRVVIVNNYGGETLRTVDRPMPLPEKWAKLSTWHSEATGRPSKFFAMTLLKRYPGATVDLIGEHLELFGQHYRDEITNEELTERTGYTPPEGQPWPMPVES